MKPRIVVVGSLNMDVVCEVARVPDAGETVLGRRASFVPGGKGANQAVAAARLGADVTLVGRLGNDPFGTRLRQGLIDEGIHLAHVATDPDTSTGLALIHVDDAAQNRITVVPGANAQLTPEHVRAAASAFQGAAMVLVQLETPFPTVEAALLEAQRANVPVMLNPAPAQTLPDHWWPLIDTLVPNESEAGLLVGLQVTDGLTAEMAAMALQIRGARRVIVTLGENGALLLDEGNARQVAAPKVTPVDTTAAGDTFAGALAVALAEGSTFDEAAAFAVRAASLSVTRRGAQTSIPRRDEL